MSADDALHNRRGIIRDFGGGATDAVIGVVGEVRRGGAAVLLDVGEELVLVLERHFADDADVALQHFAVLQLVLGQNRRVGKDFVADVAFEIRRHHVRLHVFFQLGFGLANER